MSSARWAASGGNAQPWAVQANETSDVCIVRLTIDGNYQAHSSPMDVDGLASGIALGCLTQNLEFVAANDGFTLVDTKILASARIWDSSVQLTFKKSQGKSSEESRIYSNDVIVDRRTDRHRYQQTEIAPDVLSGFFQIVRSKPKLHFARFVEHRNLLAPLLAKIERVRLRSHVLLGGLLKEVSFGDPDAEPSKIPVLQLGLPLPDRLMLRVLKSVPSFRTIFKTGLDALPIQSAVYDFCKHSAEVCFLQAPLDGSGRDFESAFELGRLYQELWLYAAKQGVSFQPMGLPLIALAHWRNVPNLELSEEQQQTLQNVTTDFQSRFQVDFRQLVLGYRIGYPNKVAKKAPRRNVVVTKL